MVTLPDLVGKTFEEGKTELTKKKLIIVQSGIQLDTKYERGRIISQDPQPNSKLKMNKRVKVVLSAGKEKVMVPKFVGKNLETVTQALREAGLRKGKISHVYTPRYAAGKIIAQFPNEGEEVGKNSGINLLISQGEKEKQYLMPDLIGKQARTVIARLKEMEFNVAEVRYRYYPGVESGLIIYQEPTQGFRIKKRNRIALEVSK
jgi:serine/threonine-protein kinase